MSERRTLAGLYREAGGYKHVATAVAVVKLMHEKMMRVRLHELQTCPQEVTAQRVSFGGCYRIPDSRLLRGVAKCIGLNVDVIRGIQPEKVMILTGYIQDIDDALNVQRVLTGISREYLLQQFPTGGQPSLRRQILLTFINDEVARMEDIYAGVIAENPGAQVLLDARARAIAEWLME